eukprot:2019812-Amphidinium_carterae.1
MLSGRSTTVASRDSDNAEDIARKCCSRLAIRGTGMEKLVHGTEVVPATVLVGSWPGLQPAGE